MPNWCQNNLTLTGPATLIHDLWSRAQQLEREDGGYGLLQAMVPMPLGLENTRTNDTPCWYSWRIREWGVKWDIDIDGLTCETNADGKSATIYGDFDSAWDSPDEAFLRFAGQHDGVFVALSFLEPGNALAGWLEADGENVDYERVDLGDYDCADDIPPGLFDVIPMLKWYYDMLKDEEEERVV